MRRRILTLALLLAAVCPLAAGATTAAMDPDGNPVTASVDWLGSVFRAFLAWIGV